ncbi:MAG: HEAT repeat domain-containing protein [Planctomycetota bacterium]|jgi:HEAT repeat protein
MPVPSLRRPTLALPLALALVCGTVGAQNPEQSFAQAVAAFQAGDAATAADHLKTVLAENPSHEDAFRMWQSVEEQLVRDLLLSRGELGTLAERFLGLATLGRREVQADPAAAAEVVARALSGDEIERQKAMLELRASFGSWAVPALVGPLGDLSSIDNRVHAMQALVKLGSDAVLPLVAVLDSPDVTTRRNAAAVIGSLRDPRGAPGLAWMAQTDEDAVARQTATESLAKLGLATSDPVTLSRALADSFFRRDEQVLKPYASAAVVWTWSDAGLEGRNTLSGMFPLEVAEGYARSAIAHGAGDAMRPLLAAIRAGQKAEILASESMSGALDAGLLDEARARLPAIDVDLALAGHTRGRGLIHCLAGGRRQPAAAVVLMDAMGASIEERQALTTALQDSDPAVAIGSAIALARLGADDPVIVQRLAAALRGTPQRLAMSIGQTGLGGGAPGWQVISSIDVAEGLARAKALPPKDVVVIQDGVGGVTLDTLVYAIKNDPRTADTPIVIVTRDVPGVSALYADKVARVVGSASFSDVQEVAAERVAAQAEAIDRARDAAEALAGLPPGSVRPVSGAVSAALASVGDASVREAILGVVARAQLVDALPAVES